MTYLHGCHIYIRYDCTCVKSKAIKSNLIELRRARGCDAEGAGRSLLGGRKYSISRSAQCYVSCVCVCVCVYIHIHIYITYIFTYICKIFYANYDM